MTKKIIKEVYIGSIEQGDGRMVKQYAPVPKNPTNKKAFCTMLYTLYFIQPMLEDWFDDSEQHRNEKAILKRIREAIAEAEKA